MFSETCYYLDPYETIHIKNESSKYGVKKFFRKYAEDDVEKHIAEKLLKNPHPNCVKIYGIQGCMIDMEYLDTDMYLDDSHLKDVENALSHLHNLNVVYIDLKRDNIGYSHVSDTYKLFDFNMSGIVSDHDTTIWHSRPRKGYILHDVMEKKELIKDSLFLIDQVAFDRYKKKEYKY